METLLQSGRIVSPLTVSAPPVAILGNTNTTAYAEFLNTAQNPKLIMAPAVISTDPLTCSVINLADRQYMVSSNNTALLLPISTSVSVLLYDGLNNYVFLTDDGTSLYTQTWNHDAKVLIGTKKAVNVGGLYTVGVIAIINYGLSGSTILGGNGTGNTTGIIYCFLEGSTILCQVDGEEVQVPVEQLQPGALVKTSKSGFKPLKTIAKSTIYNTATIERSKDRLYKYSKETHPELEEDLIVTGLHSVLVNSLTRSQKEQTAKHLRLMFPEDVEKIFVTETKPRLLAYLDERAEPWKSEGFYQVWNFSLEHHNEKSNYGVYANGNFLLESCSISNMRNIS